MKATSGAYYQGLDHVRAVAAILVYCWHVLHLYVPPQYHPDFFALSWIEEGHTGVALFMVLSGYLFAKLTDGCAIDTKNFFWNRACRLAPLFAVMFLYYALREGYTLDALMRGFLFPKEWPGASWSIAIELQFYLAFPLLQRLRRRLGPAGGNLLLLAVVLGFVLAREAVWLMNGTVQDLAYWSILGRADQLLMGMLFYEVAKSPLLRARRGALFLVCLLTLLVTFHAFNLAGGGFDAFPEPSRSQHWVWLPLLEGIAYGCLIMSYDTMAWKLTGPLSAALARLGELSYSIYLIHSALLLGLLYHFLQPPQPLPVVIAASAGFFFVVAGLAHLSYKYIEQPFFTLRLPYLRRPAAQRGSPGTAVATVAGSTAAGIAQPSH